MLQVSNCSHTCSMSVITIEIISSGEMVWVSVIYVTKYNFTYTGSPPHNLSHNTYNSQSIIWLSETDLQSIWGVLS